MTARKMALCAVLALLWGGARASHAAPVAPPAPAAPAASDDALTRGLSALRSGNLTAAREVLQAAYEKAPTASLLCALGKLHIKQGLAVSGQDFFRRCLSDAADAGEELPPELAAEARAATTEQPTSAGEIIAVSSRGGFLFVDEMVSASLRPGSSVQLTLAAGRHALQLRSGKQAPITLNVDVQTQTVTEVDFDRQQFSSSAPILLLPFDAHGDLRREGADASAMVSLLAPPLRKENGLLVGVSRLRALLRQQSGLSRCGERIDCQIGIGQRVDATFVLGVRIDPWPQNAPNLASAQNHVLQAWLIEVHAGKETARNQTTCQNCTRQALEQSLITLVLGVFDKGRRPARRIDVASSPAAELFVDGEARGQTPRRVWLLPGEHALELRRPYFEPRREQIQVDEDAAEKVPRFSYPLSPLPLSKGERATRYLAGVSGGVGLVSLAAGLGLFLRPDDPVEPLTAMADGTEAPGALRTTRPPGLALMIAGGSLLVTGIVLLSVDRYRNAQRARH